MPGLRARSRRWRARLNEVVLDRLRGRPECAIFGRLQRGLSPLERRALRTDLRRIFRIVIGTEFTRHVVDAGSYRTSLTDFCARGAIQAERLWPYLRAGETVLDRHRIDVVELDAIGWRAV